ncbi:MAG: VOC family protein, partial [Spirochaetota bacterium]
MKSIFQTMNKVGVVVRSVDATVKTYAVEYAVGPWKIWELNNKTVDEMMVNNKRENYAVRIARTTMGPYSWELIEPLDENSIFAEFLKTHGEGPHHLGYEVSDVKKAVKSLQKKGISIKQSGNWAGYDFAFPDTVSDLKHNAEIYSIGKNFSYPEPVSVYSVPTDKRLLDKPFFKKPTQVAIAVKDMNSIVKNYYDKYGIGPWVILKYYYPKQKDMYYYGKEENNLKYSVAVAMLGDMQYELMEPESGKNIYSDWMSEHGEGLNHIQFEYNYPFEEVIKFHSKKHQDVMQQGSINGLIYAYIDTRE